MYKEDGNDTTVNTNFCYRRGVCRIVVFLHLAGKVARQQVQIYHFERHWPGLFMWLGKKRYETAQRRKQAQEQQQAMHLHHV
jgi:hypothetical protein